ncbi:MAG: glycosyltransferase family 2 protein [Muribaculaceae bacterium]|nr:glycosyltransferase family 2 protein [Muribaculaceae bacterium]
MPDNGTPKVSFIIPAFNVEDFLPRAVGSIQGQTEQDWEIIIVDDGSSDATLKVTNDLASKDQRIRVLQMPEPSGSAYQPRKFAISHARASMVAPLDADDFIDDTYLKQLLDLKEQTGANAVYPSMYSYSETSQALLTPRDTAFLNKAFKGKDCVKFTLNGWKIGCNGGVIDKSLYERAYSTFDSTIRYANADELLTRQLLFLAQTVAFSPAKYHYQVNPDSITRRLSLKQFDFIFSNISLVDFVEENFPKDDATLVAVHSQNLLGIIDALQKLNDSEFSPEEKKEVYSRLTDARNKIDYDVVKGKISGRYIRLSRYSFPTIQKLLSFRDSLKGKLRKPLKKPVRFYKNSKIFFDKLHQTYLLSKGRYPDNHPYNNFHKLNYPTTTPVPVDLKEGYICLCDGKFIHGGITDRLRGILTIYDTLKKRGVPFYISWTHPFRLEDYLEPSGFDWRIERENVVYNSEVAFPYFNDDETNFHSALRLKFGLKPFKRQIHVYSNADNGIGRYKQLFHELFRPSEALKNSLAPHEKKLGDSYVAFTFRFLQLLGDFEDWSSKVLEPVEAQALMEKCYKEMETLMANLDKDTKVLVTSDSKRFLDYIKDRDSRIYIVPGLIKHSDLSHDPSREIWMKTFVDQFLLMKARKITRMRTGTMYKSGFPRFAAEVGGVPFVDHKF